MNEVNEVLKYIGVQELNVQPQLSQMRKLIREEAPDAIEKISYGVPTYVLGKNLVHFGAAKHHVSMYPGPSAIEHFADDLSDFHTSKGTIKFPLDAALPEELIRRIVRFRIQENQTIQ